MPVKLHHNLTTPLLPQIIQGIERPVHEVAIVSPFFDDEPKLLDWLQTNVNPKAVTIYTRNGAPSLTAAWCKPPALNSKTYRLLFSRWGEEGRARQIHAKAIGICHGKSTRLVFGSANFTRAALLATPDDGNIEVVLALDDVPRKSVELHKLFDPSGLANSETLTPFEQPPDELEASYPLRVIEASLDDSTLRCVLGSRHDGRLEAVMLFRDGNSLAVALDGSDIDRRAELDEACVRRADRSTTVVFLRGPHGLETNRVLLVNLKDISTGESLRKERRVRDAQRSANQFAAALLELLRLRDTDPLQSFLTYCDIPLAGIARLRGVVREPLTLHQVKTELRRLEARNLREYNNLHEAVIGFCERHTARLGRHARDPSIDAIPGCMHIVRSVTGVLATQIERLLTGLAHVDSLSINEWFECRSKLDQLLRQWLALLRVVHTKWLVALQQVYDHHDIKEAVLPDLEPLKEFARLFTDVRGRVLEQMKRFRVQIPDGRHVQPPIGPENMLQSPLWKRWSDEVRTHQSALEALAS
ncbi:MAG: phospholipase D family protein [Betaproteobacteria bacterium]|nr:phospholipase D family protein [Betaproteobacteria bacterium]